MGISGVSLSKNDIIKAIKLKGGVIKHAAELLGCSWNAIYDWVEKDLDVERVLKQARKQREVAYEDSDIELVDEARKSLLRLVKADNVQSTIHVTKTKGNFVDRQQLDLGTQITLKLDNS